MIDYRMVMAGSVLPLVETPFGDGPLHTLIVPTAMLIVIMAVTPGRRLVRRRLLGVPIGMFLHLVLDGAWARTRLFWWPFAGLAFGSDRALVVDRGIWSVVLEVVGAMLGVWL